MGRFERRRELMKNVTMIYYASPLELVFRRSRQSHILVENQEASVRAGLLHLVFWFFAVGAAHADGDSPMLLASASVPGSFPNRLDVAAERKQLNELFPVMQIGGSIKRRDAIEDYRRRLDRFNRIHLSGYSSSIASICVEMKKMETEVNLLGKHGKITKSERDLVLAHIADERSRCLADKYDTSPYWRLYQDFLDLYRERDRDSRLELEACLSQNACRRREI